MDKRIKVYQAGWGNFSHSGIDIHVVKRGSLLQRVLFHQRIQGPYPKDKAISIQSDDEFIYRIFQNKIEIKTILVP